MLTDLNAATNPSEKSPKSHKKSSNKASASTKGTTETSISIDPEAATHPCEKRPKSHKKPSTTALTSTSTTFVNETDNATYPITADIENGIVDHRKEMALPISTGLADPLEPREGRDLIWKNISMTLKGKNEKCQKKILDNVFGEVPRGHVTAIMGPSGSGKTSLLNILAGRASSNNKMSITADVRLNNYSVDPTDIEVRQKIAFVSQDDSLQITATPREAIAFSARLRLPKTITDKEISILTERMLTELGLIECADTVVGGALLKGLSGGERKRTSVGVELVTRPALVFLDEPTSGLDSFNAVQLCQLLSLVAKAGSSVLFTIHQPSSEIFNSFDQLILLNSGRVMYQGDVKEVTTYFATCGFPSPHNYNPADWIMKVALTHSVEQLEKVGFFQKDNRNIADPTESEQKKEKRDALGISLCSSTMPTDKTPTPPGITTQIRCLFLREVRNLRRATHVLKTRTVMTCMVSLAIGCIFFQVAQEDFTSFIKVQSAFGALLLALMSNIFSTVLPSLIVFPEERPVFLREYSTNHYGVAAYFASRLTMELFISGLQVSASATITYFLVGFTANFGVFWSGLYLMACASTALGVLVGSAVGNASTALEFLPAVFMPQILFSGFFVPPELMPDWLSWIRWICPLTYGVKIVVAAEFDGRCDSTSPPNDNFCDEVMNNVETNPDDVWWYFLVLVCLFGFFRLLALVVLRSKAEKFY